LIGAPNSAELARMNRVISIALAGTCVLVGCGGGSEQNEPPLIPVFTMPRPALDAVWAGRFVGTAKVGSEQRFADAVFTKDGAIRLYLGGPSAGDDGTLELDRPSDSAQFVGSYVTRSSSAARATGTLIGQGCGSNSGRFCGATRQGELQISPASTDGLPDVRGELRVSTAQGSETWTLDLHRWTEQFVGGVRVGMVAGQYCEALAAFALDDDTIVNVDQAGQVSFQSANSGCTGNGTVRVHFDGSHNAFDVALTIGNCKAPHVDMNGTFTGLATITGSSKWDYDTMLRMWLSKDDPLQPAAMTMLAAQPRGGEWDYE
jgi:hypothetical protein